MPRFKDGFKNCSSSSGIRNVFEMCFKLTFEVIITVSTIYNSRFGSEPAIL